MNIKELVTEAMMERVSKMSSEEIRSMSYELGYIPSKLVETKNKIIKIDGTDFGGKPIIFIDLDDTVVNFRKMSESILKRELSVNCRDITDSEWDEISKHENFYIDMEYTDGALDLLNYCTHYVDGYVTSYLGALPYKLDKGWALRSKWYWIYNHFHMRYVFVDSSHHKQRYAQGNILIDDKQYIIDEWNAAGGHGILCRNCKQAKEDLEIYLKSTCTLK